jgi:hypothetical protein
MFATNVAIADSATWLTPKPHDAYMPYPTPTASAPPAGTVMATVVVVWHTTAAWPSVKPGIAATSIGQYVTRFHRASSTRTAASPADIPVTMSHTRPRSAICGRTPTNTPIAIAGNATICRTFHTRRRAPAGFRSTGADAVRDSGRSSVATVRATCSSIARPAYRALFVRGTGARRLPWRWSRPILEHLFGL